MKAGHFIIAGVKVFIEVIVVWKHPKVAKITISIDKTGKKVLQCSSSALANVAARKIKTKRHIMISLWKRVKIFSNGLLLLSIFAEFCRLNFGTLRENCEWLKSERSFCFFLLLGRSSRHIIFYNFKWTEIFSGFPESRFPLEGNFEQFAFWSEFGVEFHNFVTSNLIKWKSLSVSVQWVQSQCLTIFILLQRIKSQPYRKIPPHRRDVTCGRIGVKSIFSEIAKKSFQKLFRKFHASFHDQLGRNVSRTGRTGRGEWISPQIAKVTTHLVS